MNHKISEGDIVDVSIHTSNFHFGKCKVIYSPCSTGDSWILQSVDDGLIHYISEGLTLTKVVDHG